MLCVALHMYILKDARMDVRCFLGKKYKYCDNILRASNLKGALFKILTSGSVTPVKSLFRKYFLLLNCRVSSNPIGFFGLKQRLNSEKFPTIVNLMFTDTSVPTR